MAAYNRWHRRRIWLLGIAVDSSGGVYFGGSGGSSADIFLAKYNSSGVIQWQRYLTYDWDSLYDLTIDDSGSLYFTGGVVTAKLPTDGSLTGTYGSYTYAASSLTDEFICININVFFIIIYCRYIIAGTLSDQSISLTDASSNLTSTVTSLTPSNLTSENFIGISDGSL